MPSLGKTLLAFALLHFVLQGQACLLLEISLDFLLSHFSPYNEHDIFFLVLVLEGLVGLHLVLSSMKKKKKITPTSRGECVYLLFNLKLGWDNSLNWLESIY